MIDVLVLHSRPFDARELFKNRVVSCVHRLMQYAPDSEIRARRENTDFDVGADGNISLVSVVLATALEECGASYKVWDMDDLVARAGERVADDLRASPRLIAISSSHFTTESQFADFIAFVRSHAPDTPIVVGGQLLRVCPDIEGNIPDVDYYVHGDGERVFGPLVRDILDHDGAGAAQLPGVRRRTPDGFVGNASWDQLDINDVPFPRWELVLQRDFNDWGPRRSPLMPMVFIEEMRGCIHRCAFCSYPRGDGYRLKSADRILAEVEHAVKWGATHFNLYSALFTYPPDHCREVLQKLADADLGITFSCQARVDDLYRNPDLIDLLVRAGCIHVSMGIESGDREILRRMKKPLQVDKIPSTIHRMQELGLSLCGNFFVGFPGETPRSIESSYRLITECDFQTVYLSAFVVEKAAEVYRNRDKYGLAVSEDGEHWSHPTMTSDAAEDATARFFIRLARDEALRTVIWVVQWRLARLFPAIALKGHEPEIWEAMRRLQRGVADELELELDGGDSEIHRERQENLWKQVLTCRSLLEVN